MPASSSPDTDAQTPAARNALGGSRAWRRALESSARLTAEPATTLAAVLDELGERHAAAPALLSDREIFSFAEMASRARRYTRWARAAGLASGDVIALLAPNRPDYLIAWAGITRVGATVALLNTHLAGPSLAHCINVAQAGHVIVAAEFADAYRDASPYLANTVEAWSYDGDATLQGMAAVDLHPYSGRPLEADDTPEARLSDRALLIYTSGTTGLPKAANISHRRVLTWCGWFSGMMDATAADRLYNCLPMYHSVGGVAAVGAPLMNGGSVVVRERFSASAFWSDVVRWDCTLFQYIGELCRYLLSAPPCPDERRHRLRLACGAGLREDVWTAFQDRFKIAAVLEFYAATEGAFSLYNVEGRPGAIGRIPAFLAHRFPAALVRYDPQTGAPARDALGACIRCAPDEVGEALGRIAAGSTTQDPPSGEGRFEGYNSAEDSERKILRDVFVDGDAWFRTGDLMRKDQAGFFYFVDRVGDSFRWKGENVASAEVADVIGQVKGVQAAAVYGVRVADADGRAGMAALVVEPGFDLAGLYSRLAARLPRYARPIFIRLVERLETTGTFKLKKEALVGEGYDPAAVRDALFYDDTARRAYVPLDPAAFQAIQAGRIRF